MMIIDYLKKFFTLNGDYQGLSKKRTQILENDVYYEKGRLLIEIDEIQHFTIYRQKSLEIIQNYNIELDYSIEDYTDILFVVSIIHLQ